jgi:integrase
LGVYPEISLTEARERTLEARRQLRDGKDPAHLKRQQKLFLSENSQNTFEGMSRAWFKHNRAKWSDNHAETILDRLVKGLFPRIGRVPLNDITPRLLHKHLQDIQDGGANELARRLQQHASQIFAYAIATGRAENNPAAQINGTLRPFKRSHHRALDYKDLSTFVQTLEANEAKLTRKTLLALKFMLRTFVRTHELIHAQWREIDLEAKEWVIPANKMKMRREHIVPLSSQVISILEEMRRLHPFNSKPGEENDWIFPQTRNPRKPISNATMLAGIQQLGFKEKTTVHGFRAVAMTALKERLGYPHDVVNRQLSHAPADKLGRAYDRAEFLDQRKQMMQDWADHIDGL